MAILLENYAPAGMWDNWATNKTFAFGGAVTMTANLTTTGTTDDFSGSTTVKLPAGTQVNGVTFGQTTVNGTAAGLTILASQSGQTFKFDNAVGKAYVLPTPAAGLLFNFITTVSVTSVGNSVATASTGTQFILGEVLMYSTATASPAGFAANGTSHSTVTMSGTTTGGLIGTNLQYIGLDATHWYVAGQMVGSGTLATPIS